MIHLLQQAPTPAKDVTVHQEEIGLAASEQRFYFEYTYWWPNQSQRLADKWLDDLFGERRDYTNADFAAVYRTNLNILGLPTDDDVQEMATLSRLIYGLSSTFLLTGIDRYFLAAHAGVAYQRESFRGISADGRYTFWTSAKRRLKYGSQYVMTSQNEDDKNTIPLYEQIYALAGLRNTIGSLMTTRCWRTYAGPCRRSAISSAINPAGVAITHTSTTSRSTLPIQAWATTPRGRIGIRSAIIFRLIWSI